MYQISSDSPEFYRRYYKTNILISFYPYTLYKKIALYDNDDTIKTLHCRTSLLQYCIVYRCSFVSDESIMFSGRPSVRPAVDPSVRPSTPITRDMISLYLVEGFQ